MAHSMYETIESVRQRYHLDRYQANRAIVQAPFGQNHFDEGILRLTESKSICELAQNSAISVLVITSSETIIGDLPDWIQCIQVGEIPEWPRRLVYQNRFFKWAIPLLFQNINCSLYLDSDLIITSDPSKLLEVFRIVEERNFFVTDHIIRKGWLDEYKAILEDKERDRSALKKQKKYYLSKRVPKKGDVFENNFLGRVHGTEYDVLNVEVLEQLSHFSERDQLALVYAVFKTELKPFTAPEGEYLFACHVSSVNVDTLTFVDHFHREKFYSLVGSERDFHRLP